MKKSGKRYSDTEPSGEGKELSGKMLQVLATEIIADMCVRRTRSVNFEIPKGVVSPDFQYHGVITWKRRVEGNSKGSVRNIFSLHIEEYPSEECPSESSPSQKWDNTLVIDEDPEISPNKAWERSETHILRSIDLKLGRHWRN